MRKSRPTSPAQRRALLRGSVIRTLCGIYAQADALRHGSISHDHVILEEEQQAIKDACDAALKRIRGESETDKRIRERKELLDHMRMGK